MTANDQCASVREIAALRARLRQLSEPGRTADTAERLLAPKRDVLDRLAAVDRSAAEQDDAIESGETRPATAAARELAEEGWPIEQSNAMVAAYLDDVSERVGLPVHQWGLDDADLDEIRGAGSARTGGTVEHAHEAVAAIPAPRSCRGEPPAEMVDAEPLETGDLRDRLGGS